MFPVLEPLQGPKPRLNGLLLTLLAVPATISLLALVGWAAGISTLKSIGPAYTAMNPVTALSLVALAVATYLHVRQRFGWARAAGGFVAMVGLAKIAEVILGTPAVDGLLFADGISAATSGFGRMAPNTAGALAVLGFACVLTGVSDRLTIVSQALSAVAALIALFALVGYLFGIEPLHTISTLRPMAIHTGVSIFISAAALACVPRSGIVTIFLDRGPAGALARMVLPLAVLIPIVVGAARLWGQAVGLYGTEVGVSIQVVSNVTMTSCLLFVAIFIVYRSDRTRLDREAALRRSQQFAHVGHVRWTAGSDAMVWSTEAARIHGLDAADPKPTPANWFRLVHPDDRAGFLEYVSKADTVEEEWRGRVLRPDGVERHVRIQLTADTDVATRVAYYFGTISDVTDLELARREAEAAVRAKTAFLANMSHELRTPLNGMLGFSELLLESPLDPEQREQAQTVHQSAKSLLTLLNDILDFSKIEAGALETWPEPTRLRHLLKQCLALVEPSARAKGVAVFLHIHEDVPDHLLLDGMRVRQIALNLLGNAVKFTERGFVALEASVHGESGDRLMIRVHDTGIGIAPERKEAIFADFVQADPSVAASHGGTGLGLSISRRLAHLLGGSLQLDSELGEGTKVRLELPLTLAEAPAQRETIADAAAGASKARILLVEDVEVNQRLAIAMLKRLGHEIELAADGVEAVRKFQAASSEFELVLMDVQLPLMDGLEAARRIRRSGPKGANIPIVGLSANAYATDISDCRSAGMNDHLAKPFSMAALGQIVAKWASPSTPKRGMGLDPAIVSDLQDMFNVQVSSLAAQVAQLQGAFGGEGRAGLDGLVGQVKQSAHNLAGTAASFGRRELGQVAAEVEGCLAKLKTAPQGPETLHQARDATDRFARLLQAAAA